MPSSTPSLFIGAALQLRRRDCAAGSTSMTAARAIFSRVESAGCWVYGDGEAVVDGEVSSSWTQVAQGVWEEVIGIGRPPIGRKLLGEGAPSAGGGGAERRNNKTRETRAPPLKWPRLRAFVFIHPTTPPLPCAQHPLDSAGRPPAPGDRPGTPGWSFGCPAGRSASRDRRLRRLQIIG